MKKYSLYDASNAIDEIIVNVEILKPLVDALADLSIPNPKENPREYMYQAGYQRVIWQTLETICADLRAVSAAAFEAHTNK